MMRNKKNKISVLIVSLLMLVACFPQSEEEFSHSNAYEQENYLPVDEYDG